MHVFPAYKMADVLHMPAISFFTMLDEAYRIIHSDALFAMRVNNIAYITDETERNKAVQQLEWASQHPSDILNNKSAGSDPKEIKKLLGG